MVFLDFAEFIASGLKSKSYLNHPMTLLRRNGYFRHRVYIAPFFCVHEPCVRYTSLV